MRGRYNSPFFFMNAPSSPSAIEPAWHVINRAVKIGQTHPEADTFRSALQEALASKEKPAVFLGIRRVLENLRTQNRDVLRRLVSGGSSEVARNVPGAYWIERAWNAGGKYAEATSPQALKHDAFAAEAWEAFGEVAQRDNKRTPEEMFENGIHVQKLCMTEWLRMLHVLSANQALSEEETEGIAERSVPAFGQAYASMGMGYFQERMYATAFPPRTVLGKGQTPPIAQNPQHYALHEDVHGLKVLDLTKEAKAKIPSVLTGLGCPAKHALHGQGTVLSSLTGQILEIWKREALPNMRDPQAYAAALAKIIVK